MSAVALLALAVTLSQLMLVAAMGLYLFRMARGPRAQDRVVALDAFYVAGMLLLITLGVRTDSTLYFEASAIIALMGFATTLALAKFLMRGEVIE
jgi:multicomponent K+:H+ antiporter subunit F